VSTIHTKVISIIIVILMEVTNIATLMMAAAIIRIFSSTRSTNILMLGLVATTHMNILIMTLGTTVSTTIAATIYDPSKYGMRT